MDPPRRFRRKGPAAAPRASSPTARGPSEVVESLGGDRAGVPDAPHPPSSDGPEARLAAELRRVDAQGGTGGGSGTG
eukprot:5556314-Pyramimonas_sp.AAC.1